MSVCRTNMIALFIIVMYNIACHCLPVIPTPMYWREVLGVVPLHASSCISIQTDHTRRGTFIVLLQSHDQLADANELVEVLSIKLGDLRQKISVSALSKLEFALIYFYAMVGFGLYVCVCACI